MLIKKQWTKIWKGYSKGCKIARMKVDINSNPKVQKRVRLVEELVNAEIERSKK